MFFETSSKMHRPLKNSATTADILETASWRCRSADIDASFSRLRDVLRHGNQMISMSGPCSYTEDRVLRSTHV